MKKNMEEEVILLYEMYSSRVEVERTICKYKYL